MKDFNADDVKVTLGPVDETHSPSVQAQFEADIQGSERFKLTLTVARLSALVRIQYLQDKIERNNRAAVISAHGQEDRQELKKLLDWWNGVGKPFQADLMLLAQDCADDVHAMEKAKGL